MFFKCFKAFDTHLKFTRHVFYIFLTYSYEGFIFLLGMFILEQPNMTHVNVLFFSLFNYKSLCIQPLIYKVVAIHL